MARLGIQSERIKHLVDTQVLPFLLAAGNVAALTNLLNAEFPLATDSCRRAWDHSHSIVAGGLPETSYTTRFSPRTSLMMRLDTRPRSSYGRCAQWAVMKSLVTTARSATTFS